MIIDIKRRFHQQPHDRPRWNCPLYSWGGGHDEFRTYQSCDKRRKPWESPDGKSHWHWNSFHSRQYDVSSSRDWSTPAVNCMWPRSALEMDSCPWTVRLHWATEEEGHSRLHQSRDMMLCLPSAKKERRCDVCDEITDFFHKLSHFPWTVIDDDMEILCRFVSECMTGPAQLMASMMQDWIYLQGAVTRRAS